MRKLLAPAVLVGVLALSACGGTSADPTPTASTSQSATTEPAAAPTTEAADTLVDGQKAFEDVDEDSYEENGYDSALPPVEIHADKNAGVDMNGMVIKLKAAEKIPLDQVVGITDAYEGYDGLTPIRLTFALENNYESAEDGPIPLEDLDVTGFYGKNLQPVEQYSTYEDNDGGPELDSDDPRQIVKDESYDLVRTLWVPSDHDDEDLMAEIAFAESGLYFDYFIPGDQITDLK